MKEPMPEVLEYIQERYTYRDGCIDGPYKQDVGEISKRPDGKLIRRIRIHGRNYKVHHIIWYLCHGFWPTKELDHIDRNTLNNKIENLREVSRSEQLENRGFSKIYKGISIEKRIDKPRSKPYRAMNKSKGVNLGHFESEDAAKEAVDKWADNGGKWWI